MSDLEVRSATPVWVEDETSAIRRGSGRDPVPRQQAYLSMGCCAPAFVKHNCRRILRGGILGSTQVADHWHLGGGVAVF
jgi:hypothetical protein